MSSLATAYFHQLPILARGSRASSDISNTVRAQFEGARQHERSAATALQSQAYAELEETFANCSVPNWDGCGAQPISEEVRARARKFLNELPVWLPAPDIVPENDGELAIEWDFGPNRIFSLSVGGSGPLHFAGLFGFGVERHGVEPFEDVVSPEILGYIKRIIAEGASQGRRAA
jgi:hypothetical protein